MKMKLGKDCDFRRLLATKYISSPKVPNWSLFGAGKNPPNLGDNIYDLSPKVGFLATKSIFVAKNVGFWRRNDMSSPKI